MLIALLLVLQVINPPVGVEVFRSENGLNANAIYGVLVDPNGYVWVNTDNGLYRYDGNTFRAAPSTLGREVVLANLVDSTSIAALSFDNSIDLIDIRRLSSSQILSIPDSIKLNSFASTVRRFGDTLYVGTSEQRVLRRVGGQWRNYIIPRTSTHFSHAARVAQFDRTDRGILTMTTGGSWFIRDTQLDVDVDTTFIAGKSLYSRNAWWLPGMYQLYRLAPHGIVSEWTYAQLGVSGFIHQALWRSDSELWLATREEGLVVLRFNSKGIRKRTLLDLTGISGLSMDEDGSIWVSTLRNGLYKFHYWFDRFESVTQLNGMPLERTVYSSESLVATEYNGVLHRVRNKEFTRILDGPIYFSKQVANGSTLIGQLDAAYIVTPAGRLTNIEKVVRNAGSVMQNPIKSAYNTDRHIAISAPNGVFLLDGVRDSLMAVYPGRSTSVVLLDAERIAIGRPNRLDILRRTDGSVLTTTPLRVTSLARFDSITVLIGTNGEGLLAYDVVRNDAKVIVPGAWNYIHPLNDKQFSIVGVAGLFVLELDESGARVQLQEVPLTPFGFAQQVRHVRLTEEGVLWISTSQGLLKSQLSDVLSPHPPPRLKISELEYDGSSQIPSDTLQVTQNAQRVSLSLSIQGGFNPNTHILEYLANDSDSHWIPLSQPSIEIESIRKGLTTFQFRLRNVLTDEVVSMVSLVVYKPPFWWELPWVIALVVMLSLSATVGLTVFTQRRWHRRKLEIFAQEDKMREYERIAVTRLLTSHYLFNALATIRSVARRSTDEVNWYIGRLSKVIRALIDRTSQNEVDLQSELDWIRDYVALESVGRQLSIEIKLTIDEDLNPEETYLPAFILQPVVENAMFHGAMKEAPVIHCDVRKVDDRLHILIRNRIDAESPTADSDTSSSRGLQFMTERLRGWGRYHGFALENEDVLSTRYTESEWSTEIILPFINHELPLVTRI